MNQATCLVHRALLSVSQMLTHSYFDCRQGSEDPSRPQSGAAYGLARGRMSSIKKPKPQSKKWQRKQADRERSKKQREAKAKAASDASVLPPEQVRLVPAPHAHRLRCRIEHK